MRIGIVGNYGNDNLGDDAILEGILNQLEDAYDIDRKQILVFSNNPEQTRKRYGVSAEPLFQRKKSDIMKVLATLRYNRPLIRDLDLLIIGGGGILMDLYRNAPIVYGMYGFLAKRTKTKTIVYGCGAGPIESKLGSFVLKKIGNNATYVSVRDDKSKELLQSIGVHKKIDVIPDPAFFIKIDDVEQATSNEQIHIGVTAVAYYNGSYWPSHDEEKYTNYINGMAHGLDAVLREYPQALVNFFSTKHPVDTNTTKDIQALMTEKMRTSVCDEKLTHRELLSFIQKQDMIIGTRLHSVILGITAEKPVLAVSYHDKVNDVLHTIGCGDYVIPIEELHENTDFFLTHFNRINEDWTKANNDVSHVLHTIKTTSPLGVEVLKQI